MGEGIDIKDVQDLEVFLGYLKTERVDIEDELNKIRSAFEELNEKWKDQKYEKFKDSFNEFVTNKLAHFIEGLDENINHLSKKLDIVHEYLGDR